MRDDAINRCTKLILFQAQQDHAAELIVRNAPGAGAAISYKVAQTWHDWTSPGAELAPAILSEIGRLADFVKRPFPRQGLIDVRYSGVRLLWVAKMTSAGECVLSPVEAEAPPTTGGQRWGAP